MTLQDLIDEGSASTAGLVASLLCRIDHREIVKAWEDYEDLEGVPKLNERGKYSVSAMLMVAEFAEKFQKEFPNGPGDLQDKFEDFFEK